MCKMKESVVKFHSSHKKANSENLWKMHSLHAQKICQLLKFIYSSCQLHDPLLLLKKKALIITTKSFLQQTKT